ncbi:MAG: cytochrome c3 family protein [Coriobacteriaceae bacterium]|jgi:hypothetical protein|nr:cytochrome c3 family protein [Coriobacteriaceae bacterium]
METGTSEKEESVNQELEGEPEKKKRRKKKATIVIAVVVVCVLCAGVGVAVWHEQPSFCNFICHDPMDPYVEGYYSSDEGLLVTAHAQNDTSCLSCHEASFDEQVKEASAWVTGVFYTPLQQRDFANEDFCLRSCHSKDRIVAALVDYGGTDFNPHASHMGKDITCGSCHRVHGESQMYCNQCHHAPLPQGWANPKKA